jgi:SAM-dependent methyltransferase
VRNFLRKLYFNLRYLQRPPWDTGISPPELMDFIATHSPGRALDLGCGTGTNVVTLAQCGWQVTGIDFAQRAIAIARRKAHQAGVQSDLRVADVSTPQGISGPFDLILDLGCFHTLSPGSKQNYVANLVKLLSPGGTYLMYAFFRGFGDNGPGVLPTDLDLLSRHLVLVQRQDGTERGWRPSAWFTYRR